MRPEIDGWPWIAWIHRRLYPTADEALTDARRAAHLAGMTLYIIKLKVEPAFRVYWPEDHNWRIGEAPPFHGQAGDFYYPRPDYYVIEPGALIDELFVPGENERR